MRTTTHAAVGTDTVAALADLRADVVFVGTNGLTLEHGLSTPDRDEAATKRAMVASSRRAVVLADASKVGTESSPAFASLEEIDVLVTDVASLPPSFESYPGRTRGRRRMIVTLTPNPSVDRTVALPAALVRAARCSAPSP